MKLKFCFCNFALGKALKESFGGLSDCEVVEADICEVHCDAIVSPANSFGFMDGVWISCYLNVLDGESKMSFRNSLLSGQ